MRAFVCVRSVVGSYCVVARVSHFVTRRIRVAVKSNFPLSKSRRARAGSSNVLSTSASLRVAFVATSLLTATVDSSHGTTALQREEIIARKSHVSLPASWRNWMRCDTAGDDLLWPLPQWDLLLPWTGHGVNVSEQEARERWWWLLLPRDSPMTSRKHSELYV